jgi:glutathione reductase (NADPH)
VELAGILNALGTSVTVMARGTELLRTFDRSIRSELAREMEAAGITILRSSLVNDVSKQENGSLTVHYTEGASNAVWFNMIIGPS